MCNVLERHVVRTPGAIADAFVTEIGNRGESVLVLGEWPSGRVAADGQQTWTARLLSDPDRVVWEMRLASGQNIPDARRDGLGGPFSRGPDGAESFFPLRIRRPHERVWLLWNEERQTFEPPRAPTPQTADTALEWPPQTTETNEASRRGSRGFVGESPLRGPHDPLAALGQRRGSRGWTPSP
jgi:hypothetical protein